MRQIPSGSIDLIVTSPPYNIREGLGKPRPGGNGGKLWRNSPLLRDNHPYGADSHDENQPHDEYVKWMRDCLDEMMRLLPDWGAIFFNHKTRIRNGLLDDRRDILDGYPVRQEIIWDKGPGGIDFSDEYFLRNYEVIFLIAKRDFRLAPGPPGNPLASCGVGDVWRINKEPSGDKRGNSLESCDDLDEENRKRHPAPFPVAIPLRCIEATDAKIVLDPFMGSGSTALAAMMCERDWIGCEKSEKIFKKALARIYSFKRDGIPCAFGDPPHLAKW